MNQDTPRTEAIREDLAGIPSEAQIWKLFKKLEDMECELAAVTEQRDELLRYNEEFRNETLICADCDSISKEEYDQAIEQRDRLGEAIRKHKETLPFSPPPCDKKLYEALQSLTTNHFVDANNMVEITTPDHFIDISNMIENNHN